MMSVVKIEAITAKDETVEQKRIAEQELNNRKMFEFNDLERRVEVIKKNPDGNPIDIINQMLEIANAHPDSIKLKQIIEKYK